MRTLLAFLLLCATAIAQPAEKPDDASKYWLTVYTHADWAKRPDEKQLIDNITSEPVKGIAAKHRFNHITTGMKVYGERYADSYPEELLPVIVRQRPDGGYVYKASGQNIPSTSQGLYDEMKMYAKLTPSEDQPLLQQEPIDTPQDTKKPILPWRQPEEPQDDLPDSVSIFGGTPIRDSLGLGATFMMLTAVTAFLCVILVVMAAVLRILK